MPNELTPEDYTEPRCPFDVSQYKKDAARSRIPIDRVIEKYDEHIGRRDTAAAERHLLFWLAEAETVGDTHGRLTVLNELMGHYRNTERRDPAYKYAEAGLQAIEAGGYDGQLIAATTYINAATAYKTFGEAERAYPLYLRAREIYEARLSPNDERLGGLYNNMALTLSDLAMYDEAEELYRRAIGIMTETERGGIEAAISYLNMANSVEARLGPLDGAETVEECLDRATELLEAARDRRDAYYAYVLARCAPGFRYYGYFAYADEISKRSESIYAGT